MKNTIGVSVLIPAYNEEKYIIKTLECLMKQDYENFDIIVIENASTDNTFDLVHNFIYSSCNKRENILLVREIKQGTNCARECGRKLATGKIIAQLDADCLPDSNWITKGVATLTKNKALAVTGPYDYYDASFIRRSFMLWGQTFFYPIINWIVQFSKRGGILIGGNTFVRAFVLEKIGGYNTGLTFYGDDVEIASRLIKYGQVTYSNSLKMKTSCRRFDALGFSGVQKKYRRFFINLIVNGKIDVQNSCESAHPR